MTRDTMTLYVGATRYYLGRMTYAVGDMCNILVSDWPTLPDDVRKVIERDVETMFASDDDARESGSTAYQPLGHDQDRKHWERVRALWRTG